MKRNIKVLVITTAFPRSENDVITPWLVKEIKLLSERGFEVKVFTSSYGGMKQKEFQGIKIYRFRYAPKKIEKLTHDAAVPTLIKVKPVYMLLVLPYLLSGFFHSIILSLKEKFDIIYVQWPVPHIIFALPYKIIRGSKIVTYFHGSDAALLRRLPKLLKLLFSGLCSFSSVTFTNSSYIRNLLLNLGIKTKFEIIPLGNPHLDSLLPYKEKRRINILFVGRLIDLKGVDVLIKAFQAVQKKYKDAHLTIVGDGPLKEDLSNLLQELNLDKVSFTGFLTGEPLRKAFEEASILVLPSIINKQGETEGLGMVLVEALSFGIPVIGSDVGGIPDIIINGKTGLLARPGDPDDLAEKITKLIENPELRKTLVEGGQQHIKENFSWESIIDRIEKYFREIV